MPEHVFTTRPELRGDFGMVASTHWLATAAGMAVLERGGTAADAAVAAGFVLQVVEPHLNGPGGEVPVLHYGVEQDRVDVVCGQGVAPGEATIDRVRGIGVDVVPGSGFLPACVPGAFGGWLLLLERFGTWRLPDLLAFAIGYARDGYVMVPGIAAAVAGVEQLFRHDWPSSAEVYLADGVPVPGRRFRNPGLAATYERVLREAASAGGREAEIEAARRAWYEGFVAEAVDRFFRGSTPAELGGEPQPGLLRGEDMARWRAAVEEPAQYEYKGWRVHKTGPWGQGPAFLQQLALLDGYEVDRLDPVGPDFIHLVTEVAKLALADRDAWYGDPAFSPDLVGELLDPAYNRERRTLVGERASLELRPGSPGGREARMPRLGAVTGGGGGEPGLGEPTMRETRGRGDTCHLDVVDRWGNMVSATPSGGWLQSSPVVPGLGFCMGSRLQMVQLEEGLPSSLAPGKRPRTTLTPSLALRGRADGIAFGTPGGDQQDQWTLTFFVRLAATGWNLQRLIDTPMFHTGGLRNSFYPHEFEPGRLVVEDRIGASAVEELRRRGHDVVVQDAWSLGRISAAGRDAASGMLRAAANPRGMLGYAAGR